MLSFSVGPFVLTPDRLFFAIAIAVALLVGWLLGRRERVQVEPALTRMLLSGVIGARVGFVLLYIEDYWPNPLSMIDIRDGGFLPWVGSLVAAIVGGHYAWTRPKVRKPLGLAVAAGLVLWGVSIGALNSITHSQVPIDELPLATLDGRSHSLASVVGRRPLVVNLWATWCGPCRREMPVFAEAQQREQEIEFIFVNQGESAQTVRHFLLKEQLRILNVFLDEPSEWSAQLGAQAMPTTLFIDATGSLVNSHTGEMSAATLKRALKDLSQSQ